MAMSKASRARIVRNYNLDSCDPEDLINFVIVTSDFYPELQAYYAEEAREWLAGCSAR